MARLIRALNGAEPVDGFGAATGAASTLPAGTEFTVTIAKLRRPSDNIEEFWCELKAGDQLYRVPVKALDAALSQ